MSFWRPFRRRGIVFDLSSRQDELALLEKAIEAPDFWNDQEKAQIVVSEMKSIKAQIEPLEKLSVRGAPGDLA